MAGVSVSDGFDSAKSFEDIARAIARAHNGSELTAEELPGLVRLCREWHEAIDHYLAGCAAKPVNGRPWVIEAHSPADERDRQINHKHRHLTHGFPR